MGASSHKEGSLEDVGVQYPIHILFSDCHAISVSGEPMTSLCLVLVSEVVSTVDHFSYATKGEKIVPLPQEGYLSSVPFVSGALMFGRGQTQAGVLIEPRGDAAIDPNDEKALTEFRNKIWYAHRSVFFR